MYVDFYAWMATIVGVMSFAYFCGYADGNADGYRDGHLKGYERGSSQGLQEPEIGGKP